MVRMKLRNLKELQGNSHHDEFLLYLISEPPRKGAPITRARIKNLPPKNVEKLMKTRTTSTPKLNRPMKPTNETDQNESEPQSEGSEDSNESEETE